MSWRHGSQSNTNASSGTAAYLAIFNIQAHSSSRSTHFDSGAYEFTRIVLRWTEEDLKKPLPNVCPGQIQACSSTEEDYFDAFKPSILEEARATIQAGIKTWNAGKAIIGTYEVAFFEMANYIGNPDLLGLEGVFPRALEQGKSCVAVLIRFSNETMLGIAFEERNKKKIKIKLAEAPQNIEEEVKGKLKVVFLGSLITQQRMYEVCSRKPSVIFGDELFQGALTPVDLAPSSLPINETQLNDVQRQAIQKFLAVPLGLHILQGPPGTGKTTTVVALLSELLRQDKRILVCAPSNKAVQVLAMRFLAKHPTERVMLVGVEDKLPEELQPIFLHTWLKNKIKGYQQLRDFLVQWGIEAFANEHAFEERVTAFDKAKEIHAAKLTELISSIRIFFDKKSGWLEKYQDAVLEYRTLIAGCSKQEWRAMEKAPDNFVQALTKLKNLFERKISSLLSCSVEELEKHLLDTAKIIFSTLSVAGRAQMKAMSSIDILIVDEAAQAVEAETLIPFSCRPNKCLLIGDTNQLPATVLSGRAKAANYEWSMMWRLIEECKQPYDMLTVQYRMHPAIRQWPSLRYYKSLLTDAPELSARPQPKELYGAISPYTFFDVKGSEEKIGYSYANQQEATFIVALINGIVRLNDKEIKNIGVIAFYAAQVALLSRELEAAPTQSAIKVSTVDGFQGDECDIIIISCVRANQAGEVGFLQDFRRLNVAITRARYALILVGNADSLSKGSAEQDIIAMLNDARSRGCLFPENKLKSLLKPKCQYYRANEPNSCRFGARCRFKHDDGES